MQNYHSSHSVFPPGYISLTQTSQPNSPETGPGWAWGTMLLPYMEQTHIFNTVNFALQITDPGSSTLRVVRISAYLCPSSTGEGPVTLTDATGKVLINDLSPGQYVASAGQWTVEEFPAENNGVFYRNSRIGLPGIVDGASQTLMVGERSRNVADATWVGVIPTAPRAAATHAGRSRSATPPACWS